MWRISLLVLLLAGCFVPVVETKFITDDAKEACRDYCLPGSYEFVLEKRDDTTYFCECLNQCGGLRDVAVIGKMGTLYK
jgi:hypothetical protein